MRIFRFAFLAFLSACSLQARAAQAEHTVSQVVKGTVDSVVLIVVSDEAGKPLAEGSGFIASSDGKVVTNHHVILGAHSAIVKLNNGSFFLVEGILADDPEHDIAVLKVSGKNLPSLNLADSDSLTVGDHVVAIGSPLGLENSVSDGIISGFREDSKGKSWIQTTAPVSHGNSGGPLLTMDEKVAGLVTWKATAGENLNFAVPSKLIVALLANSSVRPFGTVAKSETNPPTNPPTTQAPEREWTSMMTGHDYKIRMDGEHIYTQWTNIPEAWQSAGAFSRADLTKSGDKWVGKGISWLPYKDKTSVKWCRLETGMVYDNVSDSRIEGRSTSWSNMDVKTCQPKNPEVKAFVLIPK